MWKKKNCFGCTKPSNTQIFGRMLELQMQMVFSFYDRKIHEFSTWIPEYTNLDW